MHDTAVNHRYKLWLLFHILAVSEWYLLLCFYNIFCEWYIFSLLYLFNNYCNIFPVLVALILQYFYSFYSSLLLYHICCYIFAFFLIFYSIYSYICTAFIAIFYSIYICYCIFLQNLLLYISFTGFVAIFKNIIVAISHLCVDSRG